MLWLHPVSDGIRFGQVNAFMVLACLMDLREPRPGVVRRVPRGVLVGLAMAVEAHPRGLRRPLPRHPALEGGRDAVGTAVAVTLGAWVLLPQASFAFWGGALQDPARLGPNMGTSNQSLRGFLLASGRRGCRARSSGSRASPSSGFRLLARPPAPPGRGTPSARSRPSG